MVGWKLPVQYFPSWDVHVLQLSFSDTVPLSNQNYFTGKYKFELFFLFDYLFSAILYKCYISTELLWKQSFNTDIRSFRNS